MHLSSSTFIFSTDLFLNQFQSISLVDRVIKEEGSNPTGPTNGIFRESFMKTLFDRFNSKIALATNIEVENTMESKGPTKEEINAILGKIRAKAQISVPVSNHKMVALVPGYVEAMIKVSKAMTTLQSSVVSLEQTQSQARLIIDSIPSWFEEGNRQIQDWPHEMWSLAGHTNGVPVIVKSDDWPDYTKCHKCGKPVNLDKNVKLCRASHDRFIILLAFHGAPDSNRNVDLECYRKAASGLSSAHLSSSLVNPPDVLTPMERDEWLQMVEVAGMMRV